MYSFKGGLVEALKDLTASLIKKYFLKIYLKDFLKYSFNIHLIYIFSGIYNK